MPQGIYTRRCVPLVDRFWVKVDKNGPIPEHRPDLGPCWLWTGSRTPNGYGRINPGDSSTLYVHQLSYTLHYGPITPGLDCCHHCDVRHCVAPLHLFQDTRAGNMADMSRKGRGHNNGLVGENRPQAKMTDNNVVEIKALLAAGLTGKEIAAQFEISPSMVSRIRLGRAWTHVE